MATLAVSVAIPRTGEVSELMNRSKAALEKLLLQWDMADPSIAMTVESPFQALKLQVGVPRDKVESAIPHVEKTLEKVLKGLGAPSVVSTVAR